MVTKIMVVEIFKFKKKCDVFSNCILYLKMFEFVFLWVMTWPLITWIVGNDDLIILI